MISLVIAGFRKDERIDLKESPKLKNMFFILAAKKIFFKKG
jgi:hypothetical protein